MVYGGRDFRKASIIAMPLYIISFIGFIENINKESRVKIKYFEKHNINVNLVKIIILSLFSLILLFEIPARSSAFILALVYLVISTIKLIQINKKRQIAILWGIPILIIILIIFIAANSNIGMFRINGVISSFIPEIDPYGAGWTGMEQKSIINSANLFGKANNVNETSIRYFDSEGYTFPLIVVLANYGWVISSLMITMVTAFNIKLILDAKKIKDTYGKLLMLGIACLFIFRSIFCLLMNLNLGVKSHFDIPFISYGKLNLITDFISLAIIFSIYRRKDIILNINKASF